MPGQVVRVQRREKLGWLERSYVPMLVMSLAVTARHFFRNLRGFATGRRTDFVVQFPEERVQLPDAFRGMPALVARDDGRPRCVACGLCEFACPTRCIQIVPEEVGASAEEPADPVERAPAVFDLDMSRCMFCGLCEESCPEEAIVMSQAVEIAGFDRASMQFSKEQLLVPASLVADRLAFLRREYER